MFVVFPPVDGGVGVGVTLGEDGCEGKSVVAVDEVVMHVVDLRRKLIEVSNGDEL